MKTNIHEGHRQRLYQNIKCQNVYEINEMQFLEFVLTFVFPRSDVNPLAHDLIEYYGTFAEVLEANPGELKKFNGISDTSAYKISSFLKIFQKYEQSRAKSNKYLLTNYEIVKYVHMFFKNSIKENAMFIAFDENNKILKTVKLGQGSAFEVNFSIDTLKEEISYIKRICSIVIAHCHPNSSCLPSQTDFTSTKNLAKELKKLNIKLLDHVIVGTDGCYSFKLDGVIKL